MNIKYQFITFEGIEGSGKSSQVKMLNDFLLSKHCLTLISREPGGTMAGEQIRNILIDEEIPKLTPITELLLNFAARIEHIEKLIKPALKAKKIVVIDRFFDSSYAYQGFGFGLGKNLVDEIRKLSIKDFAPQISFLIDLPVETAFLRIKNRTDNNRYEKLDLDFHQRVRKGYLELAKEDKRLVVIDGTKSQNEILQIVINKISDS
jgi:dTMP kinase